MHIFVEDDGQLLHRGTRAPDMPAITGHFPDDAVQAVRAAYGNRHRFEAFPGLQHLAPLVKMLIRPAQQPIQLVIVVADFPVPAAVVLDLKHGEGAALPILQNGLRQFFFGGPAARVAARNPLHGTEIPAEQAKFKQAVHPRLAFHMPAVGETV